MELKNGLQNIRNRFSLPITHVNLIRACNSKTNGMNTIALKTYCQFSISSEINNFRGQVFQTLKWTFFFLSPFKDFIIKMIKMIAENMHLKVSKNKVLR
jgi:hypothetical protein